MRSVTIRHIAEMKARGEKIPMITAYDYTSARLADEAGIPILLVGDSLGMVMLGHDSTIPVTMDDMVHHVKAVARGVKRSLIVGDLPFMSYQIDTSQALTNAARLAQEGGAHTVKLEGGESVAETIRRIVDAGIPVMGHIGLTPQSVHGLGGYRVRGRNRREAVQLIRDAQAVEQAGAYAVVLELIPTSLARFISQRLTIPTIGIGAGVGCDGQVQVLHDMLGLFTDFVPKHVKRFASLADTIREAFTQYTQEVKESAFPTEEHSFTMDEAVLDELTVVQ
ncbi:MAG: 3-methyl-2-oxobutanoate hydroxymethyltransferase [Dehalococcoidia bacterium]|jgi:3-methyl-2-oxobutanoate hydroxymethyltransferase|nr:3-methyl-2-oxobutanoate hydroxymethyltransferase [Dehalococcoidia bacterium]